jgi:hypothetical protein
MARPFGCQPRGRRSRNRLTPGRRRSRCDFRRGDAVGVNVLGVIDTHEFGEASRQHRALRLASIQRSSSSLGAKVENPPPPGAARKGR